MKRNGNETDSYNVLIFIGIRGLSFVEVKNYSFDSFNSVVNAVLEQQFAQKAPACTQIRRGDFVVRNLKIFPRKNYGTKIMINFV